MQEDLKKLGLTNNEISVYLSLLKIGETPVGGIINDLKFHRQIIYNALDSLEKKNMVTKTIKNKIHHFKINDPKIIVENLQKQELIAKRISKNIEKELGKNKYDHEISIYDGRQKIQRFYLNQFKNQPVGITVYVLINFIKKFEEVMEEGFLYGEYLKKREERKIYSKNIASDSNRKDYEDLYKKSKSKLRDIKFLPDNLLGPIGIVVWEESISLISFGKNNFIIDIRNQELRSSYLKHFNLLWKIAKK